MNVLELKNISKKYGKATVVDNFSLNVEKGHICGLIGPNGAGKTTIMKMIAGLASPTSGEIGFFGKNDNLDLSRKRMAFMLEAPIIDKSMNARQNMEYVRYVKGVADKKKIDEMLDKAIEGSFTESCFDESELSYLENKLWKYLSSSEISAQKTAEEKAKIKTLIADISHQTKTPVANIKLYSELLCESNLSAEQRELLFLCRIL